MKAKLIITDTGDESVGIFPELYIVECPFRAETLSTFDKEWFREAMITVYTELAFSRVTARYDFEY